ncbi:hypothetical protein G7B40_018775 [Aetokthonos hydrillicola Thurmond2011]|uniref:Uncharacterized protein n=2 Tax=Aetokthonos TaxID=1550243 RepID=A0AAP5I840_9CYAN|nr:hypothetical protein [Aetokthonos hydrillicola CCALA 1050]MDR9896591.1 hypothetical protein [Aetokthonos hydrillicola Thurmond2011]
MGEILQFWNGVWGNGHGAWGMGINFGQMFYLAGQLVGVLLDVVLDREEMRVTSPLPLNTQPVAGTIAIGLG